MHAFDAVEDAQSFWVKAFELAYESRNPTAKGFPPAFKKCIAAKINDLSTESLTGAVENFARDNSVANYDTILFALGDQYDPNESIYSSPIAVTAIIQCAPIHYDYLYDFFLDVETPQEYNLRRMEMVAERNGTDISSLDQKMIDCVLDETWRTTPAEAKRSLDVFLAEKTKENWRKMLANWPYGLFNNKERSKRIDDACRAKM